MASHRKPKSDRMGWVFIGPAFAHLCVFALFPMAYALYLSLFRWQLIKQDATFIGLQNYFLSFGEAPFWNAMRNSFVYALMSVPMGMVVALAVALLVGQKLRGVALFRTLYYIPAISSGVAIAMVWIYVYLPETGLMNTLLLELLGKESWLHLRLGLPALESIDFLNKTQWAMFALAFMSVWTGLGPKMVLFLAGLMGIPGSLYEAASLDGASKARQFWSVTLPMLAPTSFFVLITSTIGAMQVFTPVYMMTKGGPEESTDVVGYHIYTEAWVNFNTGLAASKSFVLLAVIVVISIFQFRLMKSQMQGYSAV